MIQLSLLKSRLIPAIIIIALSLGGAYYGYNLGYDSSSRSLEPEIQRLTTANENLTQQNNALDKALTNATQLGIVKIGYIAPTLTDFELSSAFIRQIVEPDLNAYAVKLGYNVTFQFTTSNANTEAAEHLKLTQDLKKQGVDLVISGGWSSMLSASRRYVNDRDMLMVGTVSTSPAGLPIPGDRLFRMITPESAMPDALVDIVWSYGVKSVIIIQRGDSWGDFIVSLFKQAWTTKGGSLAGEAIRYSPEESNFTSILQAANLQAEAAKEAYPDGEQVAVLLLSFDEDVAIVDGMEAYTPLYDCVLFSVYSHIGLKSDGFLNNARAEHLKVFTPNFQPSSSKYEGLRARYPSLDEFDAYLYDSAWAIATSVLETRSVNATIIAGVFPDICNRLYGASGWCNLDENGDRAAQPMDVWFYRGTILRAGVYDPDRGLMTWNTGELGYTPIGP